MLVDKKIKQKVENALNRYSDMVYYAVAEVPMAIAETEKHFRSVPTEKDGVTWKEATHGAVWGGRWKSAWFRGTAMLPEECDGREVYICAQTGGIETLLFIDGSPRGLLHSYGLGQKEKHYHPFNRLATSGKPHQKVEIVLECYAHHPVVGSHPTSGTFTDTLDESRYRHTFQKVQILLRRDDVWHFYFDLRTLLNLADVLDVESLRYNKIIACLQQVYETIHQIPQEVPEDLWRPALAEARSIMKPLLDAKNGDTTPFMGLTGHSHMDTAWRWPIEETIRKCARTYANALELMDQYPEYRFLQSSPCHTEFMREHYPDIFDRIRQKVKEGRWEPNGGMWVEPDCNIPSGESMVRQFLIGQQYTRKWFDYESDCHWLPDVFGYSAALPQIMRGCGVRYFLTTKLGWNDTNRFPYDTFRWRGIDGTEVIAHFNLTHCWPDPKDLANAWRGVLHKDIQDRRYVAYGYGDGGGGPQDEMIEMSRRVVDLEGTPKTRHMSVSEFMNDLEHDLKDKLPVWQGELYLEAHRGTLTSIHEVKRGNRKSEIALRDAEFMASAARMMGHQYPAGKLQDLWKILLINQFHDILPGSSIPEVNDRAIKEFSEIITEASEICKESVEKIGKAADGSITLVNNLSWDRDDEIVLQGIPEGQAPVGDGVIAQGFTDVEDIDLTAVTGISIPSLGMASYTLGEQTKSKESAFKIEDDSIETPFAVVRFDDRGRITSFIDKTVGRELVREGGAFNVFWCGEDIPLMWDNWDIDPDQSTKMRDDSHLISREIVANGPLQLRIRSEYEIAEKSKITQDMVFHSTTSRVDFETLIDWHETHKLLKAGFDTTIMTDEARHEVQFGHLLRATHQNLSTDRARFEVSNHKWTDLSESRYGIAFLNDCKYGISVLGGEMRLSLMKSGIHPDYRGDEGIHRMDYAILPHNGGFTTENVVRPAYEFNMPLISVQGVAVDQVSLASLSAPNVIVDSIKWSEDGKAMVMRLYETERTGTTCVVEFGVDVKRVEQTNMLEEEPVEMSVDANKVILNFRPFEIITLKIEIAG